MSVTLPGELVWALNLLGFNWPEADEDRLRECARHWRDFSAEMGSVLADADRVAAQVTAENTGRSIDDFGRYWRGIGGSGGHLAEAQEAASLAADCLDAFALVIEGLKVAVVAQLVIFVAEFTADQLAAPETLGLSEGAAAAEVAVTRSIMRALIDDGIRETTRLVLQQLRSRAREIFMQMLKRALLTGALSTGMDLVKQEYEINVLHDRSGLSVGELAAAGGTGAVIGAGSALIHLRLEGGGEPDPAPAGEPGTGPPTTVAPGDRGAGGGPPVHSRYPDGTPVHEGQQPGKIRGPDPAAAGAPHTVVKWDNVNGRVYKAREYGPGGVPIRDIDFTHPTFPNGRPRPDHVAPEQHLWIPNDPDNPRAGYKRGPGQPLEQP
jgi:hypothetical protein